MSIQNHGMEWSAIALFVYAKAKALSRIGAHFSSSDLPQLSNAVHLIEDKKYKASLYRVKSQHKE